MTNDTNVTNLSKYEDSIAGIHYALEMASDKAREAIEVTKGGNPTLTAVLKHIERAMEEYRFAVTTPSVRNALALAKAAAQH